MQLMKISSIINEPSETKRPEYLYRPHPGEVFKRRCLSKTNLTQEEVANRIGISAKHLSRLVNGHVHVEVGLARKLEACTNISAGAWLHYQVQYDLYQTPKLNKTKSLMAS
jgi:antitoxin HigA-1